MSASRTTSEPRAAFLDRDGVLCELVPDAMTRLPESPLRVEDIALIPGAAEALRHLATAGWLLVGVSNQPAAAKGTVSLAQLQAVQARVVDLLAAQEVHFADFRICWHHPEGVVRELSGACDCRKPKPGMLLEAADRLGVDLRNSWMIGDTDADVLAGQAAHCHTLLVQNTGSAHKRGAAAKAEVVVPSLASAANVILQGERPEPWRMNST